MSAVIYARYSSDLQNDRSIEDQVALCRKFAAAQGLAVSEVYEDRALSGTSFDARLGLMRLIRDARAKAFRVVIVESSDRLSRHPGDIHHIRDTLSFAGVIILQVSGGELTVMGAAVSGLVSSLMLQGLADKVRRGHAGTIARGRHAGGRAYGYRPVKGDPGLLEIMDDEADVIRGIYRDFLAGVSPRGIAGELNRKNVPAPRGPKWNASTINGSFARGSGILGNELYAGTIVWNKVTMLKNPETRRRVSRVNPAEAWQRSIVPALAIVEQGLFNAVQMKRKHRPHGSQARAPSTLLSGLLRCHACGGSLVIKDRYKGSARVHCATHRESATCGEGKAYQLPRIEAAVMEGLREHLNDPELLADYVRKYNETRRTLNVALVQTRDSTARRLHQATAELDRIVLHLSKDIVKVESVAGRIKELEAEKDLLKAELASAAPPDVITLHPGAIGRYREHLEAIAAGAGTEKARNAIREIVAYVKVWPTYEVEFAGRLAAMTGAPAFPHGLKLSVGVFGGSESPSWPQTPMLFIIRRAA